MAKHILLIGAGAVGTYYASFLVMQGFEVSVATRHTISFSNKKLLLSNQNQFIFEPKHVFAYEDLKSCSIKFDLLLVCTKVLNQDTLIGHLKSYPFFKNIPILLIQNGYHIENRWLKVVPESNVWRALAFVCVYQKDEQTIIHQDYGRLVLGPLIADTDSSVIRLLIRAWQLKGVDVELSDSIAKEVWKKQCWNVPFNGLSVIEGFKNTQELLAKPHIKILIRDIMTEIIELAKYDSVTIEKSFIDNLIQKTHKMMPYHTSMCLDAMRGTPLELEAIYESVLTFSKEYPVSLPKTQAIYDQLKNQG